MSWIRAVLPSLTAVLVAVLTLAAPAEAKVRVALKAKASGAGIVATVTLKKAGRAPVRVTLQRKAGGRWVALASGTAKRGKASLRWASTLTPGQAFRLRVVATRGKRTLGISGSTVAKVDRVAVVATPVPTPAPKPRPKPVAIDGEVSGGATAPGGGDMPPNKPTTVDAPFQRVAVGGEQACAINEVFEVRCWPSNARFGEVVATVAAGVRGVGSVAVGARHGCALTAKNVYCWGDNSAKQLGSGDDVNPDPVARAVGGTDGGSSLVAGGDLTCLNFSSEPPICWGTTPVKPGSRPTGTIAIPTTIGLGAEWKIDVITPTSICGRTYIEGTCFEADGTKTPYVLDKDVRKRAIGTTSSCSTSIVSVKCSGKAPTSPVPSDDLRNPTEIAGTTAIDELATNGVTYCGVLPLGAAVRCWGAPAQGAPTVWTSVAINGFN